jgi:hypothetical protein
MPGNRGISFERLVGACVENVETVSDSQELMTALVKTSLCDQPNRALDGFKAAQPIKPKMTAKKRQSAQLVKVNRS